MRLMRIQEVVQVTGLSRMSIYRYEKAGVFPKRRRIGENSVRWLDSDVEDWMASRPPIGASLDVGRAMGRPPAQR